MEKLMGTHKLIALTVVALVAACVVQDAQAVWGQKTPFESAVDGQIAAQAFGQDQDEKEREEDGARAAINIESHEELYGYADRDNERACIDAIVTNNARELKRLLSSYGEWKKESLAWGNPAVLIRSQILIEARTREMFRVMIDAGIDPKEICQSGPDQYRGRSLVEVVKMRLGDNNPDFKSLVNYMCKKKLFEGFENPKAYFAARDQEYVRGEQLRREQEVQEFAQQRGAANRRAVQMPIVLPAPVVAPAAQLDHDLMQEWSAYDRKHRGEDAQSAFTITRRGEDLEFSV
jgi:hypothetical protein